jgi:lipopolysaccharide biosynthesis glycosyltransferase
MLYLNLEKIRQEGIEERLFEYLRENWQTLKFADQDVLNPVLQGKVLRLPKKFNYIPYGRYYTKKMCEEIPKDLVFVHYAGTKPWVCEGFSNPLEAAFWKNYKRSGFLERDKFWELWAEYKKSRQKWRQVLLYLKQYPFALFGKYKRTGLFDILFD